MPSEFASLDTSFPNLEGKTTEQKLQSMTDYLYQLLEQLRYALHNISPENFNLTEVNGWAGETITEPLRAEIADADAGLSTRIEANAAGIQAEVMRATGAEAQLRMTAEGIATRVTNAEGDISTLEQTAAGLRTDVNAASGAASTAQQTANGIKAQVTDAQGNYTVLNLKSDGLHVGNASGATTISGANITTGTINAAQLNSSAVTADKIASGAISAEKLQANAITSDKIQANSITLGKLSSDVTNSFGDDNPEYIKNTYIDFRHISSPAVYAGDFYGAKYHDSDGDSTLDITSGNYEYTLLFGDTNVSAPSGSAFSVYADLINNYSQLYLAGKNVMNQQFGSSDGPRFPEVSHFPAGICLNAQQGYNWGTATQRDNLSGGWTSQQKGMYTGFVFFVI